MLSHYRSNDPSLVSTPRRSNLEDLFGSLRISTRSRKSKPLPPTPIKDSIMFSAPISSTRINVNEQILTMPNLRGEQTLAVKRICMSDEKAILLLNRPAVWERVDTQDKQGLKEIAFFNGDARSKLRGCCSTSNGIISCCSLCDHDNWIFQGSEYNPTITIMYAQNDGCIPSSVLLHNPKFIIPVLEITLTISGDIKTEKPRRSLGK